MAVQTKPDASLEDISSQIAALKSDLAGLTEAMADYGKAQGRSLGEKASQKGEELRVRSRIEAERINGQAQHLYDEANDFVNKQPATALGIAAGVGFVIGLLSSRR